MKVKYEHVFRQPDLTELLNKPSKDATESNSIRELTSKLEKVSSENLEGANSIEDDKISEVVLSASNVSGLSTTYVTDVVTKAQHPGSHLNLALFSRWDTPSLLHIVH